MTSLILAKIIEFNQYFLWPFTSTVFFAIRLIINCVRFPWWEWYILYFRQLRIFAYHWWVSWDGPLEQSILCKQNIQLLVSRVIKRIGFEMYGSFKTFWIIISFKTTKIWSWFLENLWWSAAIYQVWWQ